MLLTDDLARQMALDPEGATKCFKVVVNRAATKLDASKAARAVANYDLVKCAIHGNDPNWGRIICAVGNAGASIDPRKVDIEIQGQTLARNGAEVPFSEEDLKGLMDRKEVDLIVNLNQGNASFDLFTTDLTYDYVKINASYRT